MKVQKLPMAQKQKLILQETNTKRFLKKLNDENFNAILKMQTKEKERKNNEKD